MHPSRPALASLCVAVAVIAIAACGCFGGSGTSATPTPSVASGSPLPSATPSPPPADPTLAADLRYRGDYEAAAAVFGAVAAESEGEERQEARSSQAELLLRAGAPVEARAVLDAYAVEAGAALEGSTQQFMLASTLDDLGEDTPALDLYSRYVLAGGALTPYANIERAKLLASLARAAEAEPVAAAVMADPAVADLLGSFAFSMGRAYEGAGLDEDALRWYALVEPNDGDVATTLAAMGAIKQRLGDPAWSADFTRGIAEYPSSGSAPSLLAALDAAAVPVSDYVRGVVLYRIFENDLARASLDAAVASGDNAAEALYYLGALDERAETDDAAIVHYEQSYAANPASSLADSSLWWRGRLLENAARYDEALLVYTVLATDFPASDWAEGARFRRGLVQYKAGLLAEAAETWGALADAEGTEGFRARMWQGKALDEAEDPRGMTVLHELAADHQARGDYYVIRAGELAGLANDVNYDRTDLEELEPDWDEVAASIAASLEPPASGTTTATATSTPMPVDLDDDERWAQIAALDAAGLRGLADSMRSDIISDAASDEREILAVTQRFFEQGDESYAARAAATLLSLLPADATPHPDLMRVAYPPAYGEMLVEAADEQAIEPLLLFALMRQESLYDPEAGSVAGALGLVQIIPATGEAIAIELGVTGFETTDLFRPETSLRFGAHYLATQLAEFGGDERHALAAYNGGPGATIDARALAEADPDLFVEDLEFDETNLYVRRVFEHWWWYRQLYEE